MENIEKESEIKAYDVDESIFEFLYKKENNVKCLQCGRCTAGCPAAKVFSDYSPREIVRRSQECTSDELAKDPLIWLCGQCYTCNSRCPRNNNPASIILNARNNAYKKGYTPPEICNIALLLFKSLMNNGVTISPELLEHDVGGLNKLVELNKLKALRVELGLPQSNVRDIAIPSKALNEIRTILKLTCDQGGLFDDD